MFLEEKWRSSKRWKAFFSISSPFRFSCPAKNKHNSPHRRSFQIIIRRWFGRVRLIRFRVYRLSPLCNLPVTDRTLFWGHAGSGVANAPTAPGYPQTEQHPKTTKPCPPSVDLQKKCT
jgi:hypothetical protein